MQTDNPVIGGTAAPPPIVFTDAAASKVGELIAEAVLAMEFSASTEDIQRTIHAHPSLAESMHEAALAADKRALNYMNR